MDRRKSFWLPENAEDVCLWLCDFEERMAYQVAGHRYSILDIVPPAPGDSSPFLLTVSVTELDVVEEDGRFVQVPTITYPAGCIEIAPHGEHQSTRVTIECICANDSWYFRCIEEDINDLWPTISKTTEVKTHTQDSKSDLGNAQEAEDHPKHATSKTKLVRSEVILLDIERFQAVMERLENLHDRVWTSSGGTQLRFGDCRHPIAILIGQTSQDGRHISTSPVRGSWDVTGGHGWAGIEAYEHPNGHTRVDFLDAYVPGWRTAKREQIGPAFVEFCQMVIEESRAAAGSRGDRWVTGDGSLAVKCAFCRATGRFPDILPVKVEDPCDVCHGKGFNVFKTDSDNVADCAYCNGDGKEYKDEYYTGDPCSVCKGTGVVLVIEQGQEAAKEPTFTWDVGRKREAVFAMSKTRGERQRERYLDTWRDALEVPVPLNTADAAVSAVLSDLTAFDRKEIIPDRIVYGFGERQAEELLSDPIGAVVIRRLEDDRTLLDIALGSAIDFCPWPPRFSPPPKHQGLFGGIRASLKCRGEFHPKIGLPINLLDGDEEYEVIRRGTLAQLAEFIRSQSVEELWDGIPFVQFSNMFRDRTEASALWLATIGDFAEGGEVCGEVRATELPGRLLIKFRDRGEGDSLTAIRWFWQAAAFLLREMERWGFSEAVDQRVLAEPRAIRDTEAGAANADGVTDWRRRRMDLIKRVVLDEFTRTPDLTKRQAGCLVTERGKTEIRAAIEKDHPDWAEVAIEKAVSDRFNDLYETPDITERDVKNDWAKLCELGEVQPWREERQKRYG